MKEKRMAKKSKEKKQEEKPIRNTLPKFLPNPTFNTFEDKPKEPWHHLILSLGLEGEWTLLPNGTITDGRQGISSEPTADFVGLSKKGESR
jgi:hypothetical protein